MSKACDTVAMFIDRPRDSLSEAERLVLEQHLSACADCTHTSRLAHTIGSLIDGATVGLGTRERERAIAGAFERASRPRARPVPRRSLQLVSGIAAAAVLVLGLRTLVLRETQSEALARNSSPASVTSPAVVVAPALALGDLAQAPEAPSEQADEQPWVELAVPETRTLEHAKIAFADGARFRLSRKQDALELTHGQALLDVASTRSAPFAVITRGFRVEVLASQCIVTPERVEVLRGRVQVQSADTQAWSGELSAGQALRSGERAPTRVRSPHERAASPERTSALLERARAALAAGDVAGARTLIARADKQKGTRSERAEAGTLGAECALLERSTTTAIAAYLAVAEQYGELIAGQNALFAAAQLRAASNDHAGARKLLDRYLVRYPSGRFADEARARLK